MKKKIIFILLILLISIYIWLLIQEKAKIINKEEQRLVEFRGVFISYLEYFNYFNNKNDIEIKKNINTMISNLSNNNFNSVILQVRPFSDAIYISDIYPCSYVIKGKEDDKCTFDILSYFIEQGKIHNIDIYAWINPYRVRSSIDVASISSKNPAYQYLNTNNVAVTSNGIYYNPASSEVIDLIKTGISEIIDNYQIAGIVFDDYFYPNETVDLVSYDYYQKTGGNLSLDQFRYENVNTLVKEIHSLVKAKKLLFGISPQGNIENNYQNAYADIKTWLSSEDYVDFIMPQIYFGFNNDIKPFYPTLMEWHNLISSDVDLIPALAAYKVGEFDSFAKSGSNEWIENNNILAKQIVTCRSLNNVNGFALYRYDFLFNENLFNENTYKELDNLYNIL